MNLAGRLLAQRQAGSILLELLVAFALFALALGPLCNGLETAVERAAAVRSRGSEVKLPADAVDASAAWAWGPHVVRGEWQAGQTLVLAVKADIAAGATLGLWADGWFLGELEVTADGRVEARVGCLGAETGAELVARVRLEEAAWGPPWRSLVPDALGAPSAATAPVRFQSAGVVEETLTAVHPASLANPQMEVSEPSTWAVLDETGLPVFLVLPDNTDLRVRVGAEMQSLRAEGQRVLDLYF